MKNHVLKLIDTNFDALRVGLKTCECRMDDRGYDVGDTILFREYLPCSGTYTGRSFSRKITAITTGEFYGIIKDYALLSLRPLSLSERPTSESENPSCLHKVSSLNHA